MLILTRRPGQWVEVTHDGSKDKFMVGVKPGRDGAVDLMFDNKERTFVFERPDRVKSRPEAPFRPPLAGEECESKVMQNK